MALSGKEFDMKHLLIALLLSVTVGCASFDKRADWPDYAYGGTIQAVALEGYSNHHSAWKSAPNTAQAGRNSCDINMHNNPDPIAS